jgi:hypothetical protein
VVAFLTKIGRVCFVAVILWEFAVAQLVEALHYKARYLGLIAGGIIRIFLRLNPSGRTWHWGRYIPKHKWVPGKSLE